jgi:phosphate-selective porin OprO/OprP
LLHAELAGNYGSAHFQTEWLGSAVDQYGGPMVFYQGAYFQCGYFLTGESAGYNKLMGAMDYNCKPFNELLGMGPGRGMCGWGAWEAAFRWSYLDLQSSKIVAANYQGAGAIGPGGVPAGLTASNGGAGPSPTHPNPGILNEPTLALNWWWNQYTRVQFNYIFNMLSSQYHGYSQMEAYTARFQIEF